MNKTILLLKCSLIASLLSVSCGNDPVDNGPISVAIPQIYTDTRISVDPLGGDAIIEFEAVNSWEAIVTANDQGAWASVKSTEGEAQAGRGKVVVACSMNSAQKGRSAQVSIRVNGYSTPILVCTVSQNIVLKPVDDLAIISYMDEFLKTNYLFNEEYQAASIRKDLAYTDFLSTNLLKLKTNEEDGGVFRESDGSDIAGQRYVYSYIQQVSSGAKTSAPASRAEDRSMIGFGIGSAFAVYWDTTSSTIVLGIDYVYPESPAAKAGLKRGCLISKVNNAVLTGGNYTDLLNMLLYAGAGTSVKVDYKTSNISGEQITWTDQPQITMQTGAFEPNPIVRLSAYPVPNDKSRIFGYMAYVGFDAAFEPELATAMKQYKEVGIKELILDLRHNPGGTMVTALSMSSIIAGASYYGQTFAELEYNKTRKKENDVFKFMKTSVEPLGLERLFVIISQESASCSEMIITSLRGVGFPVIVIGSKSDGKNVGMEVQYPEIPEKSGNIYEFAPVTFRAYNAKKESVEFKDGIIPDYIINNQNGTGNDDADGSFPHSYSDWVGKTDVAADYAIRLIMGQNPSPTSNVRALTGLPAVKAPHPTILKSGRVERTACKGIRLYERDLME